MSDPKPVCPLCSTSNFKKRFSKKGRDFLRCQSCDIELQFPLPTHEELSQYYDNSFAEGMYQEFASAEIMKRMTATRRLKEISRVIPVEGRWLDVGAANGIFVETATARGVDAEGVELSQFAVNMGRDQGIPLYCGTIDDVPEEKTYDCITAFDVLEHVLDPNEFLASIYRRLDVDGKVVLTVPNTGGVVRRLMGQRWYFYIPEEHLHYFNRSNLKSLLEKHGFEIQDSGATCKPMTYDYALTQFAEFNPLIYKMLKGASYLVPSELRKKPLPLPIGEIRFVARKVGVPAEKTIEQAVAASRLT